ncbi:hypothetical protein MTO96_040607 [Rhipicephalus appendiculatus]
MVPWSIPEVIKGPRRRAVKAEEEENFGRRHSSSCLSNVKATSFRHLHLPGSRFPCSCARQIFVALTWHRRRVLRVSRACSARGAAPPSASPSFSASLPEGEVETFLFDLSSHAATSDILDLTYRRHPRLHFFLTGLLIAGVVGARDCGSRRPSSRASRAADFRFSG